MSAHSKKHLTDNEQTYKVVIELPGNKKMLSFVSKEHLHKLEVFLEKYGQSESTLWETLASKHVAKHKKSGLVLRGARYREGISQKEQKRTSQKVQG
jgi:hypothetical protein